jgi:hypothetical protein
MIAAAAMAGSSLFVAGALAAGDEADATRKTGELLAAVQRFTRSR